MPKVMSKEILRVIDANVNRSKEGLRVCEDVARFYWDHPQWTRTLKKIRQDITRHGVKGKYKNILAARHIERDVGRGTHSAELKRADLEDVFFANMQRTKESLRVLEEVLKVSSAKDSAAFKKMRYDVYALEKKALRKI